MKTKQINEIKKEKHNSLNIKNLKIYFYKQYP